ncbi:hypothetical protein N0V90_006462 [Kalmusia sp. IMI 367209]|nr:hypothetical protein N0V90_006462 [Kalmusia sp. IMI 367209]
MAIASSAILLLLLSIAAAYVINRLVRPKVYDRPLPPGPKGIPILGNVNDLPKPGMLECHHWLEHKDVYGPISSITVLGQTFVIINDAQIALELLRDRATIHSARPHMVFSSDMIGWKNTLAFSGYTDTFKIHRKNIAKVASSNVSLSVFDRVQEEESVHFLLNVLDSPENLFDHIKKEAGAVILKVTYGYTAEAHGKDPFVEMAGRTMHEFADATVPGKWAVDIMPFLRYAPDWLPGTKFKDTARQMASQLRQTTEQPYNFVKQQMREKKHQISFLSQAIENIGSDAEMENIHKWSASSMYLGGADTTVSSLMTFFLAMTLFPEVQKKAQEELDRVIGGSRLPTSADRKDLPYIEAIMKETHRWHPVAPMALPHSSTEEDSLAVFKVEKLVENGKTVEPELKFEPGVVSHPVPYRTSITPRSEKHKELIKEAEKDYPWQESDAKALETVKW